MMKKTKQTLALLGLTLFVFAIGPLWVQFTTEGSARAVLVSPLYWGLVLLATVSFFGTIFLIKNYGGDPD
jgi:FtsH-binding integral membrane protein